MIAYYTLDVFLNGSHSAFFNSVTAFTLLERYDSHHSFEIRVPLDSVEDDVNAPFNKSKNIIGSSIKIKIGGSENGGAPSTMHEFNGVVTSIAISRNDGASGDLVVRGLSPTIIFDHGLSTKVYGKMPLQGLVSTVGGKYPIDGGGRFKVNVSPNPTLEFVHQHKESTYAFLARLANRYGQWFFYDGKDCVFGKLSGGTTVELNFGSDLTEFEVGLFLLPNKFTATAIDENSKTVKTSAASVDGLDQLANFAYEQSNKYFYEEQTYNADLTVQSASDLQDIAKIRRAAIAAGLVRVSGTSDNPKLKIGASVSIKSGNTDYGTYTATVIKHTMNGQGNYQNQFEGISSSSSVPLPIGTPSTLVANSNK